MSSECRWSEKQDFFAALNHEFSLLGPLTASVLCFALLCCVLVSFSCSLLPADDQAPVQASGLRPRGGDGHQGAGLLPTHRLGSAGQQGDPAALQAQSGEQRDRAHPTDITTYYTHNLQGNHMPEEQKARVYFTVEAHVTKQKHQTSLATSSVLF